MAKSGLSSKRTITDKITVKGILSEDGTYITYTDENEEEKTISFLEFNKSFRGCPFELTATRKTEDELLDETDEDSDDEGIE